MDTGTLHMDSGKYVKNLEFLSAFKWQLHILSSYIWDIHNCFKAGIEIPYKNLTILTTKAKQSILLIGRIFEDRKGLIGSGRT